jgi:hypothetical protein
LLQQGKEKEKSSNKGRRKKKAPSICGFLRDNVQGKGTATGQSKNHKERKMARNDY